MAQSTKINKVLEALDASARLPACQCPPLERRIAQNLASFELLRASGLKWSQIALGLPSWRQKDGTPVSEDQIRGAVSRVRRMRGQSKRAPLVIPAVVRTAPEPLPQKPAVRPPPLMATVPPSSLLAQLELTRKSRKT